MQLKEKIVVSIICILSVFVLSKMMRFISYMLKYRLNKSNPKLVSRADWFFSEKKNKFFDLFLICLTIASIIMIWMNKVEPILTNPS